MNDLNELHENGFVVLSNVFSDAVADRLVQDYLSWCDLYHDEVFQAKKTNGFNSRLVNFHTQSTIAQSLLAKARILDVCDTFFGGRKTSIYTSLFFQEGTKQPLHRDSPVFCTVPENLFLGVWFALENANLENGNLIGVPGSHKLISETLPFRYQLGLNFEKKHLRSMNFSEAEESIWSEYQDYISEQAQKNDLEVIDIPVDKGDVIIWHPLFLHGGRSHISKATRYSMVMHLVPEQIEVHGMYLYHQPWRPFAKRDLLYRKLVGSDRQMLVTGRPAFAKEL